MIRRRRSIDLPQGVRERLLDTADHLFYKEGVRAVGIDRVLAEADAAKASLYLHFGCKDELVAAHVERRVAGARSQIDKVSQATRHPTSARYVSSTGLWNGSNRPAFEVARYSTSSLNSVTPSIRHASWLPRKESGSLPGSRNGRGRRGSPIRAPRLVRSSFCLMGPSPHRNKMARNERATRVGSQSNYCRADLENRSGYRS